LRASDVPLSGQYLAERLGISRVALWKRVEVLKQWGYAIDSSRRGYRLLSDDGLSAEDIAVPGQLFLFDELDSTMDEAHRQAARGAPSGSLVLALRQQAGRALDGSSWPSPSGGFYASLVVRCALPVAAADGLVLTAAAALLDVLTDRTPNSSLDPAAVRLGFRWPNQLWSGQRRIAGILLESVGRLMAPDYYIIGIGIDIGGLAADGRRLPQRAVIGSSLARSLAVPTAAHAWSAEGWCRLLEASACADFRLFDGRRIRCQTRGLDCYGRLLLTDGTVLSMAECLAVDWDDPPVL